jgi:hypothetical protein
MKPVVLKTAMMWTTGFRRSVNYAAEVMELPEISVADLRRRQTVITSIPDTPAPQLLCPPCDHPLVYRQTVVGGVKPVEQWDYFECRTCGRFVYRDRT